MKTKDNCSCKAYEEIHTIGVGKCKSTIENSVYCCSDCGNRCVAVEKKADHVSTSLDKLFYGLISDEETYFVSGCCNSDVMYYKDKSILYDRESVIKIQKESDIENSSISIRSVSLSNRDSLLGKLKYVGQYLYLTNKDGLNFRLTT